MALQTGGRRLRGQSPLAPLTATQIEWRESDNRIYMTGPAEPARSLLTAWPAEPQMPMRLPSPDALAFWPPQVFKGEYVVQ